MGKNSRWCTGAIFSITVATLSALASCSVSNDISALSTPSATVPAAPSSTPISSFQAAPGPGTVVSPGGVTTAIHVPAESTEEQYAQACRAASQWMDSQGGNRQQLVEPFLKLLQISDTSSPATLNTSWAQLSLAQQAAVIIAVTAAAEKLCT